MSDVTTRRANELTAYDFEPLDTIALLRWSNYRSGDARPADGDSHPRVHVNSALSHLECPSCETVLDADGVANVCSCGSALSV
jgi:hypothetical protein